MRAIVRRETVLLAIGLKLIRYLVQVQKRVLIILVECLQNFNFLFGVVLHSNDILSVIFFDVLNVRLILQQRVEHALSLMRNHPPAYDNQLVKVWGGSH